MSLAYDKVIPSALPNKWNLSKIILVACVMGVVATLGSLFFLAAMRNNYFTMSVWQRGVSTRCSAWEVGTSEGKCHLDTKLTDSNAATFARAQALQPKTQGLDKDLNPYRVWPTPSSMNFCSHLTPSNGALGSTLCGVTNSAPHMFLVDPSLDSVDNISATAALAIANEWVYFENIDHVPHHGYQGFNMLLGPQGLPQLSILGYSTESGDQELWDPRHFPYSSAVENTALFLLLCLVTQLSVLAARVDGWFFTRRPGYVLLTIVSLEMICTTIVAAAMRPYPFWYPNIPDKPMVRLTAIDGRYIGVCWLWAIIIFMVMEVAKYLCYYGIELSRTREIEKEKRNKLKSELRRRMASVKTRHYSSGRANSVGGSGLAPKPISGHSYANKSGKDELAQPLLSNDSYATA